MPLRRQARRVRRVRFRKASRRRYSKRRTSGRKRRLATFTNRKPRTRSRASLKKRVKGFYLTGTRKFHTPSLAHSHLAALLDVQYPCWKFWSDSVGTARTPAQQQGWYAMFAHTAAQIWAYQTYNPQITGNFTPSNDSIQNRTALEMAKHNLFMMNLSLNNPVMVTAYLCKPRHRLTTSELLGITQTSSSAAYAQAIVDLMNRQVRQQLNLGLTTPLISNFWQDQKTSQQYPGQPTSNAGNVSATIGVNEPGASLFNQKAFTSLFKIMRVKNFVLPPGKRARLSIEMPTRMLSPAKMGYTNTSGLHPGTWSQPYLMYPYTRFWLLSFHGTPAPYIGTADAAVRMLAMDCPPALLGMYQVEQWCIRPYPNPIANNVAQRMTLPQDITTATPVPYSIGRVAYVGETVTAGRGAVIDNAATQ